MDSGNSDCTIEAEGLADILKIGRSVDVVLDVTVDEGDGGPAVRFDTLSDGGNGKTYASRQYSMCRFGGLFELLDDFWNGRIRFFSSGKSVQAFLLSLFESEESFFAEHGFDFVDYYGSVNDEVVVTTNSGAKDADGVMNSPVSAGYGISDESKSSHLMKEDIVLKDDYMGEISKVLVERFRKNISQMDEGGDRLICIIRSPEGAFSVLMDETVGLPMVFHKRRFMDIVLMSMFETECYDDGKSVSVDVWRLRPEATVGNVISLCRDGGGVIEGYGRDTFAERFKFVDHPCENVTLNKNSFGENDLVPSII